MTGDQFTLAYIYNVIKDIGSSLKSEKGFAFPVLYALKGPGEARQPKKKEKKRKRLQKAAFAIAIYWYRSFAVHNYAGAGLT